MQISISSKLFSIALAVSAVAWFGILPAGAIGPGGDKSFSVTIVNPDQDPVPTADIFAPGRKPVRIGPVAHTYLPSSGIPLSGFEVIDTVDTGQTLILAHLNVIAFSNLSNNPFVEATCNVLLKTPQLGGGFLFTPFMSIPLDRAPNGTFFGSLALFLPLHEGEGLNVLCLGDPQVSQGFRVTAGGYYVSASP